MSDLASIRSLSDGTWGTSVGASSLTRSAPEPRSSLGAWTGSAGSALAAVGSVASNVSIPGFNGAEITNLLNQQIQIQQVMQTTSMFSNVERSKHETEMAPIRNMRVG